MSHESYEREAPQQRSSDRVFGFVFAAVFVIVALFPLVAGGSVRLWSLGVSGAFLLLALVAPAALGPLNRLWMRFGMLLHKIVSPLVLGFMFFVVITPIGLLMRALGKDPLRLRFERASPSYWILRQPPGPAPDSLNNQF